MDKGPKGARELAALIVGNLPNTNWPEFVGKLREIEHDGSNDLDVRREAQRTADVVEVRHLSAMEGQVLGAGLLNWPRSERVSDRYGMVTLYGTPTQKPGLLLSESMDDVVLRPEAVAPHLGKRGWLLAVARETRDSDHIGDLFRGIGPSTPEVGEVIVFGCGTLVEEEGSGDMPYTVGLRPDDGRSHDWLNPRKLYRAHSQTVELRFVEA